ncbi:MAG TPA: TIGR02206 family membrane protein [Candidatus Eisenbacteria bacterium]|nr:TIGR02206 family membrane protein [Candidatus Eisenbacteria bacterium]
MPDPRPSIRISRPTIPCWCEASDDIARFGARTPPRGDREERPLRDFVRFSPEHLGTLAGLALLAFLLSRLAARSVEERAGSALAIRAGLAMLLLAGLGFALADALPIRELAWLDVLPLHLCDMAVLVAVWALLTRGRLACEILYFWGLSGTLIAMTMPDVDKGFPDTRCVSFFALHGAVALSAVVMTAGVGVKPRPGSHWRIFAITNAYAAVAATIDFVADENFLYLRAKPSQPSILDVMGPWPWYILTADVLAMVLFWLLMLPFRRRHAG